EGDGVSVAEDGETSDTFTVRLTAEPTADVTVDFDGGSQLQDMAGETLTFTAANWDETQEVTATALDDAITEPSPHDAPIAITTASTDTNFDALVVDDVVAKVDDDDVPAIEVTAPTVTTM